MADTRAIVPHGQLPYHILAALVSLAEQHGFDARWVNQRLREARGDAMQVVERWGDRAVRQFRRSISEWHERSAGERQEQRRSNERNAIVQQNN